MTLNGEKDAVVGMICVDPTDTASSILVVSEKGNGKRSQIDEYRLTNRGGKGVKTLQITEKTGALVAIKVVVDGDDLMITNRSGIVIRTPVEDLRVMGRATQGVRLIRLDDDDEIADVTVVHDTGETDTIIDAEDVDIIIIDGDVVEGESINDSEIETDDAEA
jgi:DNA gyrase subunit A